MLKYAVALFLILGLVTMAHRRYSRPAVIQFEPAMHGSRLPEIHERPLRRIRTRPTWLALT